MSSLAIAVATHKAYWMPEDSGYLPVWVGTELHGEPEDGGYYPDNTGINISAKNKGFCELTALYWLWKNRRDDYAGLVHYRRHFAGNFSFNKKKRIATSADFAAALEKAPIIVPRQRYYFIETTRSHYSHIHYEHDLDITRTIIEELYPEYLDSFETVMNWTHGHRFNMFVMRRDLLDEYANWLFSLLFELESRVDVSDYSPYNRRIFGFVSERLLDCWLNMSEVPYIELPVVNLESQHWPMKAAKFLGRKISGSLR